ncbi:hypothetical protein G3A43_42545 [Paraburkholderia aspalathi]|uniref:hypothetical protein n=1 Tax=Paraburkholderia nemoris TaxID=2793076 RepID=UPI00190D41E9|nr:MULTISPECIES: hypothetical protein [Paraburkholderia]MBK3786859.1 hypothetical protein [Paraburkholderia aspalathi]
MFICFSFSLVAVRSTITLPGKSEDVLLPAPDVTALHGCTKVDQAVQGYSPMGGAPELVRMITAAIAKTAAMFTRSKISDFILALNPYRVPPYSAAIASRAKGNEQLSQRRKQAQRIQMEVAVARNACAAVQMRHLNQAKGAHGYLRVNVKNIQRQDRSAGSRLI